MGFKLGGSASKQQSSENQWQNSTQDSTQRTNQTAQQTGTGSRAATFDNPYASNILAALTGRTADPYTMGTAGVTATNAFGDLTKATPSVNPNVENIISASNKEGEQVMQNNLAKVRAGAYRGGTGANMYGQGKVIADAANKRSLDNANLRYGAYEADVNRGLTGKLAGASGLAGLEGQQQQGQTQQNALGAQLLALLRGETTQQQGTSNVESMTIGQILQALRGGKSGTTTNTSGSAGLSWGA